MGTPNPGVLPTLMSTMTTFQGSVLGDTVMPIALTLGQQQCAVRLQALLQAPLASSPSTSTASPTPVVPPQMKTPDPGVPHRLMPTMTMSQDSVLGDTVMPIALTPGHQCAVRHQALLQGPLASSHSTLMASPTPLVPPQMKTPDLGVPPRLMPTTTMSQGSVLGDTVMANALPLTLGQQCAVRHQALL